MSRASLAVLAALLAAPGLGAQGFVDVTDAAGLAFPYLPTPAMPLADEPTLCGGASVGDFDGDGWDDIFWFGGSLGVNRLYRNDRDGTFTNVAAAAGVDDSMPGSDAKWADYDDDGDLDLFLTAHFDYSLDGGPVQPNNILYRNDGNGTFTDVTDVAGLRDSGKFGASFGDIDKDGDLDLAVVSWRTQDQTFLWRNNGDGTFTDSTQGFVAADPIHGFAPTLVDYDADGDNDLLVAADFNTSRVYKNIGNWFWNDVSQTIVDGGPLDDDNGMGSALRDIDGDGDLDWFVTSIYLPEEVQEQPWQAKSGNRMWRNNGDGTFSDVTDLAGVRDGGWGWGTEFADFDNDGDADLAAGNGYYIGIDGPLEPLIVDDRLRLYENDGTGLFTERSGDWGVDDVDQNRGLVVFDYDRDGRQDLLVANHDVGLTLYRNEIDGTGGWLDVQLRGSLSNRYGVGARVTVTAEPGGPLGPQVDALLCGDNYLSQSPLRCWFGTAAEATVNVRVTWQTGAQTLLLGVPVDQRITVYEAGPWTDLGNALAGTNGVAPELIGDGFLSAGSTNGLEVRDALPGALGYLFLGLAAIDAPFKGGVLVPAPLLPPLPLPMNMDGRFAITFTWPADVPAGQDIFWQVWVSDAGAPKGLSASNAVVATTG